MAATSVVAVATEAPAVTNVAAASPPESTNTYELLNRGDILTISLMGIPTPQDVHDVIDGLGNITLPLIGKLRVEGMTTAEAEALIEKLYIDGGFYTKIDVIVVAQEGEYFVRGEVKHEGKFAVRRELTLLQAIAEAGGFTDYAKTSEVRVIRGSQESRYNTVRIEDRKEKDPLVKAGDIVIVPRRRI